MYKIFGAVIIIFCGISFGISLNQNLKKKANALSEMIAALQFILNEIEYKLTPITEIFSKLSQENTSVSVFFESLIKQINSENDISLIFAWKKTVNEFEGQLYNMETSRILNELGDFIGRYDKQQQINSVNYSIKQLSTVFDSFSKEVKVKGRVYKTCSLAAGLLFVLVLV